MNIRKTIAATAVAGIAIVGFGAGAFAEEGDTYVSKQAVPGHQKQERQGDVVTHFTQTAEENGVTYDYVVNTRGDFGGDPYLNSGQMMNRVKGDDGSTTVYIIRHEDFGGQNPNSGYIWGSWTIRTLGNGKG